MQYRHARQGNYRPQPDAQASISNRVRRVKFVALIRLLRRFDPVPMA